MSAKKLYDYIEHLYISKNKAAGPTFMDCIKVSKMFKIKPRLLICFSTFICVRQSARSNLVLRIHSQIPKVIIRQNWVKLDDVSTNCLLFPKCELGMVSCDIYSKRPYRFLLEFTFFRQEADKMIFLSLINILWCKNTTFLTLT